MTDTSINTQSHSAQNEAQFSDYFALLKPRVMTLVVFTAFVGLLALHMAVNVLNEWSDHPDRRFDIRLDLP